MSDVRFQGEQFTKELKFSGVGYNDCDQMIIVIYRQFKNDNKIYFVKVPDIEYSGATLIELNPVDNTIINLFFSEDITKDLECGNYHLEIRRNVSGENMPILKSEVDIFSIQKSIIV